MGTDLKRCPFCGGEAEVFEYWNEGKHRYLWQTNCTECFGGLGEQDTEEKAVNGWNRRNSWHTELPTEDGQYFVAYRWGLDNKIMHDMASQICYGATTFFNGTWKIEFPFIVVAWQRIEPFTDDSPKQAESSKTFTKI